MIKLDEFSPHEYALGDKQVQILLSGSHVHACTQEKMIPRRYVRLEPEMSPEIFDTLQTLTLNIHTSFLLQEFLLNLQHTTC